MASWVERRRLAAFSGTISAAGTHFAGDSARSLLDVGGGTGWLAEELGRGLERIVVLEPRARARAKGKKRRPSVEFVEGKAEAIPFPDGSFERIIAVGSLHHFADAAKGLAEIRRVMTAGGRLAIFEYQPDRGKGRFLVRFACHHALRTPDELKALVERASFEQVSSTLAPPGYLVFAAKKRPENLDNGTAPLLPA